MEVIREAQIINISDPDKKGKIKIKILPEMEKFSENMLPWVSLYTSSTGTTKDTGKHITFTVNSYIRVLVEDYPFYRRIRYISDDYVEGLYVYDKVSGLSSVTELGTQTYPEPMFQIFKDGTIEFHNTTTGEYGTFFKNGNYTLVDSNGNYFVNCKSKKIKIYNSNGYISLLENGNIELNGNTKYFVTHAELNTSLSNYSSSIGIELGKIATGIATGGGAYTPTNPTFDISAAKTNTILTK